MKTQLVAAIRENNEPIPNICHRLKRCLKKRIDFIHNVFNMFFIFIPELG